MSQRLPDKVRAGDQLSAAWLNSIVDYLKYLNDMQARRRLLKGVGYAVSESPGGSSLTIDRQAVVRVLSDDLALLRNEDFEVRIQPKGLCEVNPDTGDWDKVVQVHRGSITNHRDFTLEVVAKEGGDGQQPASSAWDAEDWVDMGTLPALGKGSSENATLEVYVKITLVSGMPTEAVFTSQSAESGAGGESVVDENGECLYVPIATVSGALVDGTPRYYITQYQQGPIEMVAVPLAQYNGEGSSSDIEGASDIDNSDADEHPGLIASARAETQEESKGNVHWCINAGELIVPLAHAPSASASDVDGVSNVDTARAGLILGLAIASNVDGGSDVDGSAVDASSLWYIENGILYHPEMSEPPLCNYLVATSGESGSSVDCDGLIRSIGKQAEGTGWGITDGDIRIPLADSLQSSIDWGGEGLLLGISEQEGGGTWAIEAGNIRVPLAATAAANGGHQGAGLIRNISAQEVGGTWAIESGDIRVPLASAGKAGLIQNAVWLNEGENVPRLTDGTLYIPRPDAPGTEVPLANFNNSDPVDNAGTICGVEYNDDGGTRITQGVLSLPKPDDSNVDYTFDPEWFTVSESNEVSLNVATLDALVNETVSELAVNVEVNGVLSSDEYGELTYATTTTNTALAGLALDTSVIRT